MSLSGEILLIVALILANGFFAGAEIAILTARRNRLEKRSEAGDRSARLAAELARDPTRFIASVQIGITLVGTLAAVFGGARLVTYLSEVLEASPVSLLVRHREAIAMAVVVLSISFLSLILGEIVPKRIALAQAERLALLVAIPMHWIAKIGRPIVWFMSLSSEFVLAIIGQRKCEGPSVSVEDIEHLIKTGTHEGLLDPAEQMVAQKALRLGDRTVREIMRPRIEIDALDVDTPSDEVLGAVAMAGFARLPVHEGDLDHILGVVYTKDLLRQQHMGWPMNLRKLLHPPLLVPETLQVDKLLELFRKRRTHMAIVLDEFGGTEGLVTLADVLEELVGEIRDEPWRQRQPAIVARDEKHWLVDGNVNFDDLLTRLGRQTLLAEVPTEFNTVAGLVLFQLKRIAKVGDRVVWNDLAFEVVQMDGMRIDRLLVSTDGVTPAKDPPSI